MLPGSGVLAPNCKQFQNENWNSALLQREGSRQRTETRTNPMPLPPFNFHQTVAPETGRVDKINAVIGTWIVPPLSALPLFSIGENGMQPLPSDTPGIQSPQNRLEGQVCALKIALGSMGNGWIFNAPKDALQPWSAQKVRAEFLPILQDGSCPLFSGSLKATLKAAEYRLSCNLWLNPTRYAKAVCARHAAGAPMDAASKVREFARPIVFDGEASLDQQDNWIPDIPGYRQELEPAAFHTNLAEMMRNVEDALDGEMQRAANAAGSSSWR